MERVELEKIVLLASRWRQESKRTGGLVVVYRGDVQGWIDTLRDPQNWMALLMGWSPLPKMASVVPKWRMKIPTDPERRP